MRRAPIFLRHTVRSIAVLAAMFLVAQLVTAQTAGPSEPTDTDIMIPDLLLKVEELTVDDVQAVLPPEGALALGQISIPLPAAGDLTVDESAFTVPLPGAAVAGPGSTSSFFSSGRLGAGSVNHIVGDLSLYKLGESPRFRVEFAHEGLDGYQFQDAGTGFFSSTNTVSGWI
ncbi:MAG: hypothetical protein E4H09_04110, partial [Spirochaetales bacterium]